MDSRDADEFRQASRDARRAAAQADSAGQPVVAAAYDALSKGLRRQGAELTWQDWTTKRVDAMFAALHPEQHH